MNKIIRLYIIFLGIICSTLPSQALEFPLKDVAVAQQMDLSGQWLYMRDTSNRGHKKNWFSKTHDRTKWRKVTVPGVWDMPPGDVKAVPSRNAGWFSRTVPVPADWKQDITLCFLGAMYTTDVWVNGEYVGVHRGGYSPFYMDITELALPGEQALIVVRASSETKIPNRTHGFQFFGGLTREVFLLHQPAARIEKIQTWANVIGKNAVLNIKGEFLNYLPKDWSGEVEFSLLDGNKPDAKKLTGRKIPLSVKSDESTDYELKLNIPNAHLWHPDDPFLYRLRVSWDGKSGMEFPVGLKEITISGSEFLLNGKKIWLQGFGWHEQVGRYGPCIPMDLRRAELKKMKDVFQCNALRPGHYMSHPQLYSMCDELGLLTFPEIPAWQTHSQMHSKSDWEQWLEPQLREMVLTLRNHASVAFWGISNETSSLNSFVPRAIACIEALDKSRPMAPVFASTEGMEYYEPFPMGARNFHYGWYHSDSVYSLPSGVSSNLKASRGKPIWVAELGAISRRGNLRGGYGNRYRGNIPYMDKMIRYAFQYCAVATDQIIGATVWTWSDFTGGNSTISHGILDINLKPKMPAYTVCNLFNGDLRAFIIENQTSFQPTHRLDADIYYFNPKMIARKGQYTARWQLRNGARRGPSGEFKFAVKGQRSERIDTVRWTVPQVEAGVYSLWVEFFDENDNWIYTNVLHVDIGNNPKIGTLNLEVTKDGKPIDATVIFEGHHLAVYQFPGLIFPFPPGQYTIHVQAKGEESKKQLVTIKSGKANHVTVEY